MNIIEALTHMELSKRVCSCRHLQVGCWGAAAGKIPALRRLPTSPGRAALSRNDNGSSGRDQPMLGRGTRGSVALSRNSKRDKFMKYHENITTEAITTTCLFSKDTWICPHYFMAST